MTAPDSFKESVGPGDHREVRFRDGCNSFMFDPPLTRSDAITLQERAKDLGYQMSFRGVGYTLEQVQEQLITRGPSSFLNRVRLQEDISPKETPQSAEQRMAERLRNLAPKASLIITDPYLFTNARKQDSDDYATSVANMIGPALTRGVQITIIVDKKNSNTAVQSAVLSALKARENDLEIDVFTSEDFHDRFWIADRERGLIVGTSLNKIGGRIFFVDELSRSDVAAVLHEVDTILSSEH